LHVLETSKVSVHLFCYIVCVACFIFATHPKTITHTFNLDYNVLYIDKRFELHVCVYVSPVDW